MTHAPHCLARAARRALAAGVAAGGLLLALFAPAAGAEEAPAPAPAASPAPATDVSPGAQDARRAMAAVGDLRPKEKTFNLDFGAGVKVVDGADSDRETFFTFHLRPDLNIPLFGTSLGAGLNLEIDVDHDLHVRDGMYDERSDWLTILRFVRVGHKGETFYGRLGALDSVDIGYRTIVNHYRSDVDFTQRKVGAELALDLGPFGFESFTSSLSYMEIIGGRAFARPIRAAAGAGALPIVENLEFGGTYVTDQQAPGRLLFDSPGKPAFDADGHMEATWRPVYAWGLDAGLPLLPKSWVLQVTPYADRSHLVGHGDGRSYGVIGDLKDPFGVDFNVRSKLERRESGDEYIPGYFDATYDVDRFTWPDLASLTTKRRALDGVTRARGIFGELGVSFLDILSVDGSYLDMFGDADAGLFTARARVTPLDQFQFSAEYARRGIGDLTDVLRVVSDQSYVRARAGYSPWTLPGVVGVWLTVDFERAWRLDKSTGRFEAIDVITPGVGLNYSF
ncbi:MAG: hypothetical protein HY719_11880 [Planctomycetes bacterium]|nr:hypothetical protein [Planctomycetota bacterium]